MISGALERRTRGKSAEEAAWKQLIWRRMQEQNRMWTIGSASFFFFSHILHSLYSKEASLSSSCCSLKGCSSRCSASLQFASKSGSDNHILVLLSCSSSGIWGSLRMMSMIVFVCSIKVCIGCNHYYDTKVSWMWNVDISLLALFFVHPMELLSRCNWALGSHPLIS